MVMSKSFIVALAAIGFCASAVHADGWHITERTGGVAVLHSGVSKAAYQGSEVAAGDTVITNGNGRAVLVNGNDYLIVSPSSHIQVVTPSQPNDLVQIIEEAGSAIFKIKHLDTPHFAVKTPYLAVVVKGTTFSVSVSEAGTSVQVIDGAVEVVSNDGGAHALVKTGMIGQILAKTPNKLSITGDKSYDVMSSYPSKTTDFTPTGQDAAPSTTVSASVVQSVGANVIAVPITESSSSTALASSTRGLIEGNTSYAANFNMTAKATNDALALNNVIALTSSIASSAAASTVATTPAVTTTPAAVTTPVVEATPAVVSTAAVVATPPATVATVAAVTSSTLTSCAGVPNCNGATYTGPSNVQNGSSCAGVANCNGGAFNVNGNATTSTSQAVTTTTAAVTTPVVITTTAPVTTPAVTTAAAVVATPVVVATPAIATVGNTIGCSTACNISYTLTSNGKSLVGDTFTVTALTSSNSSLLPVSIATKTVQGGQTQVTILTHNALETAVAVAAVSTLVTK